MDYLVSFIKLQADLKCWYEVVSPFIFTKNLHKWILTTSQGKQKTGVCMRACVFVCMHVFFLLRFFQY